MDDCEPLRAVVEILEEAPVLLGQVGGYPGTRPHVADTLSFQDKPQELIAPTGLVELADALLIFLQTVLVVALRSFQLLAQAHQLGIQLIELHDQLVVLLGVLLQLLVQEGGLCLDGLRLRAERVHLVFDDAGEPEAADDRGRSGDGIRGGPEDDRTADSDKPQRPERQVAALPGNTRRGGAHAPAARTRVAIVSFRVHPLILYIDLSAR
jgi:hypothetical protein